MIDDRFVPPVFARTKPWALALLAGVGVWLLGTGNLGFWHWNLGAGMVFAVLWLSPVRAWLWIVIGTGVFGTVTGVVMGHVNAESEAASLSPEKHFFMWMSASHYFIGNWADWILGVIPAAWLRRRVTTFEALLSTEGTALLHVAALIAALLMTATDVLYVLQEGFVADVRRGVVVDPVVITPENGLLLIGTFAVKNALGYFLGIMLMAPVLFWMVQPDVRWRSRPIFRDALIWLVPSSVAFVVLAHLLPGTRLAELLRLLLLAAVIVFAVRHGWRGAVFSILVVSLALGIEDHLGAAPQSPIWLQMFVAIAGAMALMFGATVDQLRQRGGELAQSRDEQQRIAAELVEAAARNVRAEEAERGRMALELHDSLGQGITAFQTQLRLIETGGPADLRPGIDVMGGILREMRGALKDVLEALRPAALTELGLVKAIDHGGVRQQAERAGLRFTLDVGDHASSLSALDEAASVAIYRIVQEAVTNIVRHSGATCVAVRLRLRWRADRAWVSARIVDDGCGLAADHRAGNGLRGMRDRALMLGGGIRVVNGRNGGARVRAWLRAHGE